MKCEEFPLCHICGEVLCVGRSAESRDQKIQINYGTLKHLIGSMNGLCVKYGN